MRHILLFCLCLFLLTGCITSQSAANKIFAQYEDVPIKDFIRNNGMPSNHLINFQGESYYEWFLAGGKCQIQLSTNSIERIMSVRIKYDAMGIWTTSMCYEAVK